MIPLRDTIPSSTYPVVTVSIIIANTLAFFYQLSLGNEMTEFLNVFAVIPARSFHLFMEGSVIRASFPFITSMFLHGGWWHIIGNMLYLWIFGDNVEDMMGHGKFLVFYLLCGVGSSLAHALSAPSSAIPSLGASGAIAGVLGAYFVLFPRSRVVTVIPIFLYPYFVEVPAVLFLGLWFILQLASGLVTLGVDVTGGGVAWWAHISGFALGVMLLPVFRKRRDRYQVLPS